MSIKEVLDTSFKLVYDEHIEKLLSIPEKYLSKVRPNTQIPYSEIFKSYNSDVAQELNDYGDKLRAETKRALEAKGSVSTRDKEEIQKSIENCLKAELYINRFDIFIESIGRTLTRYGMKFEPEKYRVDIPKSLAATHAKNTCRKIQAKLLNDIDVLLLNEDTNKSGSGAYSFLNDLYNKHQLAFWGLGLLISVILGALLV